MSLLSRLRDFIAVANVRKPIPPAGRSALKPRPVATAQDVKVAAAKINAKPFEPLPPTIKAAFDALNAHPAFDALSAHPAFDAPAFFAALRAGQLRHRQSSQVQGTEMLLSKMHGLRTSWVAYALATTWHETGTTMKPIRENLNYSVNGLLKSFSRRRISDADARRLGRGPGEGPLSASRQAAIANVIYGGSWGRENLGNTMPGDGSLFLGRGYVQITGRTNYDRAATATGYPLVGNPDLTMRPDIAAEILRSGMVEGWFTGKSLSDYLPDVVATREQFKQARRIINGTDKDDLIAGYAVAFQAALVAGGWK